MCEAGDGSAFLTLSGPQTGARRTAPVYGILPPADGRKVWQLGAAFFQTLGKIRCESNG